MFNIQRKWCYTALAAIWAAVAVLNFKNYFLVTKNWCYLVGGILLAIAAFLNLRKALIEKTDDTDD